MFTSLRVSSGTRGACTRGCCCRPGGALAKKPRVYELAAEFGVESKAIMVKLQQMGEFVRSASSTVEHLIAYKLRQDFAAQAQRKPVRQGSGAALRSDRNARWYRAATEGSQQHAAVRWPAQAAPPEPRTRPAPSHGVSLVTVTGQILVVGRKSARPRP